MIIHEFATNASKYGALQNTKGRIAISWEQIGSMLHLAWVETGGPLIAAPPTQSGFGSTLARRTIKGQFDGQLNRDWKPQGLSIAMTLSIARLAQ